jgi:single-strand DNA-binding protein
MPIGETIITLIGNLTRDPELAFTPSGVAYCTFNVASNSKVFDKTTASWIEGKTVFMRCTAWRWLAENAEKSLSQGTRVIVTGALRQFEYTSADNVERTGYGLDVQEIGASLLYATATVQRTSRTASPSEGSAASTGSASGSRGKARSKAAPVDDPWASTAPAGSGWGSAPAAAGFSDEPPF